MVEARRVLFLDRDGVLNVKPAPHDYVKSVRELRLLRGIEEPIKLAKENGFLVIVISNQRGVARGLYTLETLHDINYSINEYLKKFGCCIDAFYYCTHNFDECECRKPKPGMFLRARDEWQINLEDSYMIGDGQSDLQAGQNARVRTFIIPSNSSFRSIVEQIIYKK